MKTCPSCGTVNEDKANFCQKCGGKLVPDMAPLPAVQSVPPPTPRFGTLRANPKTAQENSCAVCSGSFQVGEEIVRCENCGKYYHQRCKEQAGGCISPECKTEDLKTCPFCAEKIKKSAVKCRFCGQILDQSLKSSIDLAPKGNAPGAVSALVLSLVGLLFTGLGIIFGILAIVNASKANKIIAGDPNYTGKGMATAGLVIGVLDIIVWFIVIVAIVSSH